MFKNISPEYPVIGWWSGGADSAVTCKKIIDWFGKAECPNLLWTAMDFAMCRINMLKLIDILTMNGASHLSLPEVPNFDNQKTFFMSHPLMKEFQNNIKICERKRYRRWRKDLVTKLFTSIWHPLRRSV